MSVKPWYQFGRTLTKRIAYFAFPRTGSHLFRYCTQGLFDLVALPHADLQHEEAVDRQRELDPRTLYALDLREDGVPYQPVLFDGQANGRHGVPTDTGAPTVLLIRHPIAAVYSLWNVQRDRWGVATPRDLSSWIASQLEQYERFYAEGWRLLDAAPQRTLLIRFEAMLASPEPMERLVELVGVRPKLSPEFVHSLTRFDTLVRGDVERTFFRAGTDKAWERDAAWVSSLAQARIPDLERFGYRVEVPERSSG